MQNQIPISEGGKKVLNTVKDELFPIIEKLKNIIVRVYAHRIYFFKSSTRELHELQLEYEKISADFFVVATKLQTPDILFKDLPENPQHIADWFQYQGAFQKNLDQGIGYIEIIGRAIDRKNQIIQNRITLIISIIAILVSILLRK